MYGGPVLGVVTTAAGAATIASLPNTGSHNAAIALGILSIAVGVAILTSVVARSIFKRYYGA